MAARTAAPRLLKIPEVAERLGCSDRHVYRLIAAGAFSVTDIGVPGAGTPKSRIPETELAAYIGGNTTSARHRRAAG